MEEKKERVRGEGKIVEWLLNFIYFVVLIEIYNI